MNITVMGTGRWGSFIAWYLNKIGHDVISWGRTDSPDFICLRDERKNDLLEFNDKIKITDDLKYAVSSSEIIVISISSQNLRDFMKSLSSYDLSKKIIVLCMKGIEETTCRRLSEVVEEFVPESTKIAIWVGPGHVQDYTKGIPNCMVIDCKDKSVTHKLIGEFSSDLIRFYVGNDLIGNEIGAAAKNVIGIAAGMLDGIGYTSLKGALMSRATREISRLIQAMGGNGISAYSLSHLGDYQATLFSEHSHNRKFGEMIILGKQYTKLAEGVSTTNAIVKLGKKYNVDLPICSAVYQVINEGQDARKTLSNLFLRSIKQEF